mmetsp:Transcript_11278/g.15168  ORF Transcript_11278/g.15168 Transcript_11278/m.15168 type:complete len:173 (-) Transcript_11278:103-621(-)
MGVRLRQDRDHGWEDQLCTHTLQEQGRHVELIVQGQEMRGLAYQCQESSGHGAQGCMVCTLPTDEERKRKAPIGFALTQLRQRIEEVDLANEITFTANYNRGQIHAASTSLHTESGAIAVMLQHPANASMRMPDGWNMLMQGFAEGALHSAEQLHTLMDERWERKTAAPKTL